MYRPIPSELRTKVEVALACGTPGRTIVAAFGVSRTTQRCWCKTGHKERELAATRRYKRDNPDRVKEYQRKAYERHRHVFIEHATIRENRMKKWPCSEVEKLMIKYRYEDARRLSQETGVKHEVDHVWPLSKGGPHLPWNLQILTKDENREKGAKI